MALCSHLGCGTGASSSVRQEQWYSCTLGKAESLPVKHLERTLCFRRSQPLGCGLNASF